MSILEELRWKKFPVLDQGSVALVDAMGDDAAICQAARVSFGTGTKSVSDDRTLLRFLMRHHHATPFEMCEIKLHVRVPMDTWRQWIRHRTANVNEYSTRYSEAIDATQATQPDAWRLQATANKQGSGGFVTEWGGDPRLPDALASTFGEGVTPGDYLSVRETALHELSGAIYKERLSFGVAREQARKDLPLSTYTEAYWKCDLRNVLGFLALRMDGHAQQEIRAYATVIGKQIVAPLFPLTWEAFCDYTLESMTLSLPEVTAASLCAKRDNNPEDVLRTLFRNDRERVECREKLRRLDLIERI